MKEIWKDISGYKGEYLVSNLGRIKSLKLNREHIMKLTCDKDGYKTVGLLNKGKRKFYKVHRLVALAFIPNTNNLPEINHKDENKSNNNVENLEWCNRKYNINYGTAIQRKANACSKKVRGINIKNNSVVVFKSAADAKRNGFSSTGICHCLAGRIKTSGGYKWYYEDDFYRKD